MKKVKFEKLNDAKFQKMEIDIMKEVKGGLTKEYCPTVITNRTGDDNLRVEQDC